MARFLTAMPPVEPILLNENILPKAALSGWEWFVKSILQQRESAIIDGKLTPHIFPIEQSAWNILKDCQHQHAIPAAFSDAKESALEGKFLTNTARIALILHVVKQIESGVLLSYHKPITGDTMESACIIAEWFIEEQKRIYDEFAKLLAGTGGDTTLTPDQQAVMKVLVRTGKAMTKDEMKHRSRPLQRMDKEGRLDLTLSELVKMKKIHDKFRTGNGVKDGTIEYQFTIATKRTVTEPPEKTGEYGTLRYATPVTAEKNENSTLSEFDESSDKVSENSTVTVCRNCTHFRLSSYPNGHCESGCVQQNLPCCDFVAKTPTSLF